MRYFLTLAYKGTRFCGWQRQPGGQSVQETLEEALSVICRQAIKVTGCGRTDTGVHARYYVAHFDAEEGAMPATFFPGINSLLPWDIAIYRLAPVHPEAHARYDAFERKYEYHISTHKDPFAQETAWFYPQNKRINRTKLQAVAQLLPQYTLFFPFCKTDHDADTYECDLKECYWEEMENSLVLHVKANRFLRGMVRLIVGACIKVAVGQLELSDVKKSMDEQLLLPKPLSVPARGLFLTDVKYPFSF